MDDDIEIEINSILLENRNILKRNYAAGKTKVRSVELREQGFIFPYHTHELKHQDIEQLFEFCYDYGIGKLNDGDYQIIKLPL